ncbi:hypothetical protein IW261DRAFT_1559443 [Armillaria novae-zelandiae]|uniref:WW domain-containing protein n=1 Tax=Armillaria novae-zelandiae TaxID=153914 RepID=A0AA39TFK5_9AGAR|nr:hypothetical protein IW261DRAFT_1559443 [Armillaria novae-zelandiae]
MSSLASALRTHCQKISFRRNSRGPDFSPDGANQAENEMQTRETAVARGVLAFPSAPVVSLRNLLPSAATLTSATVHSDVAVPEPSCADPTPSRKALSDELSIDIQNAVSGSMFAGYREEIFEEEIPSRMGHYDREHNMFVYISPFQSLCSFTANTFSPNEVPTFSIPPMTIDFEGNKGPGERLPSGWKEHTHSDGKPYFLHENNASRIITEEWIYDDFFRNMVSEWASILNAVRSRFSNSSQVKDWHLVIKIQEYTMPKWTDDDCYRCQYYFVNHDNESLFWLSDFKTDEHLAGIRGPITHSQIYHFLRQEYWHHIYLFADTHPLSNAQWREANRMVVYAYSDVNMSNTSTVAHSVAELEAMMKSLGHAEKNNAPEIGAAVLRSLLSNQFLNYHGQRSARTNRGESVFGDDPGQAECTHVFKLLSPFLFYAPVVHLDILNKFWVDGLAMKDQWVTLIERCTGEWSEHTIYATILLNANVAFLAIPSVDEYMKRYCGLTQVLSALSVVSSLGSILVGLLMGRYHRTKKHISVEEIIVYMKSHYSDDSRWTFERLAIIYSIPYALLMWAMVLFSGAFFSMCWESLPQSVRISVLIGFAFTFAISVLCIYQFWECDHWTTWAFGRLRRCWEHHQDVLSVLGCIRLRLTSIWCDTWKRNSNPEDPPV